MLETLVTDWLIKELKLLFDEFLDIRTGSNRPSENRAAGWGVFSVFFTAGASFLEYQEEL